jgi:hypothetical protein
MTHRRWIGVLAAVAAVSLMGNVYLLTRPPSSVPPQRRPILPAGAQLQEVRGLDEAGDVVRLQLAGAHRPTLLYVVTPACVWCTRNQANFIKLAEERSGQYTMVLVSLTNTGFDDYVASLRPRWGDADVRVLSSLSREDRDRLMLGATPQTIVVGTDGRILQNWVGAYTDETLIGVENFFLLQMPGLSDVD